MVASCVRCGAPSGALMGYSYDERAVWLFDLEESPEIGTGYMLCTAHADRLSPPLGWTLTDRRSVARLFAPLQEDVA